MWYTEGNINSIEATVTCAYGKNIRQKHSFGIGIRYIDTAYERKRHKHTNCIGLIILLFLLLLCFIYICTYLNMSLFITIRHFFYHIPCLEVPLYSPLRRRSRDSFYFYHRLCRCNAWFNHLMGYKSCLMKHEITFSWGKGYQNTVSTIANAQWDPIIQWYSMIYAQYITQRIYNVL